MNIYNLWIKEYAGVSWISFLILFIIAIFPMVIKQFRNLSIFYHQAYNLFFNFIVASQFSGTAMHSGDTNFAIAFFYAFGIGYSLLYLRKEDKKPLDRNFSILSFIFFSGLIIFTIINQLK